MDCKRCPWATRHLGCTMDLDIMSCNQRSLLPSSSLLLPRHTAMASLHRFLLVLHSLPRFLLVWPERTLLLVCPEWTFTCRRSYRTNHPWTKDQRRCSTVGVRQSCRHRRWCRCRRCQAPRLDISRQKRYTRLWPLEITEWNNRRPWATRWCRGLHRRRGLWHIATWVVPLLSVRTHLEKNCRAASTTAH
jgi:hypothetical protein